MLSKVTNAAALVLFAIWIALFGFEALTASQQVPSEQQGYGANAAQGNTETIKRAPDLPHSDEQRTQRKAKQGQAAHGLKEFFVSFLEIKLTDLLIAIFTVVLGIKTAGLFRETAGLRDAADKQRIDTLRSIEAAEKAAKATERAADATAASVDLTKRQLRAYVTVNGVMRTKDPGDLNAEGFAVLVDIKSSGQTPASDSLQWARIEIREFPLVTPLPIHCLENPARGILPPEAKNLAFPTYTRDLTTIEENAILANHTAVYVYGEVDYFDIFGERHLTQFRFRCNGQGYPLGMFKADGEGNEAT
jgi:hypothetical protein